MFLLVLPKLILDTFLDLLYFPLWWYTGGVLASLKWCWRLVLSGNNHFAPGLWLGNIFVPMYGQHDIEGKIISFFMRLVQVLVRSLALFVWILVCLSLFLIWLALPIFVFYGFWFIKNPAYGI